MKKFLFAITASIAACACAATFAACSKPVDFFSYVSEYRHDVYIYEDDGVQLKIYLSDKETPYNADGIKGVMSPVCEVYYYREDTPECVEMSMGEFGGEMNYMSVTRTFYLSFACDKDFGAGVDVNLDVDGEKLTIRANNVREEGAIDGKTALKCVTEYDSELFTRLTNGAAFRGEIGIRLIYDEGCYYYVGVTDCDKQTHSYLLDASDGRVIAQR